MILADNQELSEFRMSATLWSLNVKALFEAVLFCFWLEITQTHRGWQRSFGAAFSVPLASADYLPFTYIIEKYQPCKIGKSIIYLETLLLGLGEKYPILKCIFEDFVFLAEFKK